MPFRLIADAAAQTTVPGAVTSGATSIVVLSSANFTSPQSFANGQGSLTILDSGNGAYNSAAPLATPYEYAYYTNNNTGTNTLSGLTRGVAGTTAHAYTAGATIAQGLLAEDLVGSVPWKYDEQLLSSGSTVTIPASGSMPASYLGFTYRGLRLTWKIRTNSGNFTDTLSMRINGDTGASNYRADYTKIDAGVATSVEITTSSIQLAFVPGGLAAGGLYASGWVDIPGPFDSVNKTLTGATAGADSILRYWGFSGIWFASTPITSLSLILSGGAYVSGSFVVTHYYP